MGIISIMFGIIVFAGFAGLGVILSNVAVSLKDLFAVTFVTLADVSTTTLTIGIVAVCGFIGLMIGLNFIMQGITYNKVCKIERRRRRRHD
jgi:hypothetical protein